MLRSLDDVRGGRLCIYLAYNPYLRLHDNILLWDGFAASDRLDEFPPNFGRDAGVVRDLDYVQKSILLVLCQIVGISVRENEYEPSDIEDAAPLAENKKRLMP